MVKSMPEHRRGSFSEQACTRELMVTTAGYHPHADGHVCIRKEGTPSYVFLYCIDGCGRVKFDGKDLIITSNQGVFLNPGHPHEYAASKTHPWSYYYIHYEGTLAPEYTRLILDGGESGTIWFKETDEYLRSFNLILANLTKGWTYPNMVMASACLHKLFSYFFLQKTSDAEELRHQSAETRVQAVAEMIEENPQNQISVPELAKAANLSVSRFREIFKQRVGMSPKKYALQVQLEKVKELLVSGDLCIYEISEQVGIPDAHYLSRLFSDKVGMSPSEYRDTYRDPEAGIAPLPNKSDK